MVNSLSINMGYNNDPYIIMPLKRVSDMGLKVVSSIPIPEPSKELIENLDSIKPRTQIMIIF